MDGELDLIGLDAHRKRQARLRIQIDEQNLAPCLGQGSTGRGHGGRLGDATFLIGHCHDP